jgi:hypothetical protein
MVSHRGNQQLTIVFTATPDLVEEGDRLFENHAAWMARSHHRDGDRALLSYDVAKGPELSGPLDPSSEPTGNTTFVLNEVYETPAGVEFHWREAAEGWEKLGEMVEWAGKCKAVTTLHGSQVIQSLW